MLVSSRCPGCQSVYRLPDRLSGKKVRCKSCSATFKVPAASGEHAEAMAAKKPVLQPVAAAAEFEDSIVDSAVEDEPQKGKTEPTSGGRRAKPEKPAKTRKRFPVLLIVILLVGLFVVGGAGAGLYWYFFSGPPKVTPRPAAKTPTKPQPKADPAEAKDASDTKPAAGDSKEPTDGMPAADAPKDKASPDKGGAKDEAPKGNPADGELVVSYTNQVKPFLTTYCGKCHMDNKTKGGANLTSLASMKRAGKSGKALIVPNEPDKSYLVQVVEKTAKTKMPPPKEKQPTADEKGLLRRWIAAGAVDDSPKTGASLQGGDLQLPAEPMLLGPDAHVEEPERFHQILSQEDAAGSQKGRDDR